jgi:hypothetical protein
MQLRTGRSFTRENSMRLVGQHPLDPVALGVSGPGHFARAQKSGRFQVKADIKWQAELFGSVANDAVDGAHSAASKCHGVVALKQTTLRGAVHGRG